MNGLLCEALAELNLEPGQTQRVRVNGYDVEIRRLKEESMDFANSVMLEPWVTFPEGAISAVVPIHVAEPTLPDPPELPDDGLETT